MNSKMDAFDKAASYLALKPRTEAEIRNYLKNKEYSPSEIDDGIEKLREYGYLNDVEYSCSYIRQAAARGWGRLKMELALTEKGVSRSDVEAAWIQLEDEAEAGSPEAGMLSLFDEKKRALEIGVKMARQQLSEGKELDEKFLNRVGRRLAGKGFTADSAYFAVNKLRGIKR